ncbi:MAG: winged helix-turn-helix transcriptional regulator, partial [Candidatus Aenigmarchaeota archaeon]|nr:winged helix-turn-helix transcriptional regulator [Candidatus Aenigmarchaeota archaeon]
PANVAYSGEDKELLSLLRQERIRKILIHLMENRKSNARKISDELGVSPSNLSWYLKMLLEKKLVVQKRKGRFRFYSVSDEKRIIKYLVAYKASFFDKAVDRFIESWELE